jgi:hypothetical protein
MKTIKESKFKGTLSRCEVESLVNPLRDREPTKQWMQELKEVLLHFDVQQQKMCQLTADSNKCNTLGRRYSNRCFIQIIDNFIRSKGSRTWTLNAQKTVNDHLDILVDYLSKPEEKEEDGHVPTLRERLEKERAEGKWPSVDERLKEQENDLVKAPDNLYVIDNDNQGEDSQLDYIYDGDVSKLVDTVDTPHKVRIKRKKHKKHKSNNIYITIKIGR